MMNNNLDGEWDCGDGYLPESECCGIAHTCGFYSVRYEGDGIYYCASCDEIFNIEDTDE